MAAKKTAKKSAGAAKKRVVKNRGGRPLKGDAPRDVSMTMRVTQDERAAIVAKAESLNMSITDLVVSATDAYGK